MPSFVMYFKTIALLLLLQGILSHTAMGQAGTLMPLSERLGDTIDASERNYFGLFPLYPNFQSGRLYKVNETLYRLRLQLIDNNQESEAVIELDNNRLAAIQHYLDNFETLFDNEQSVAWGYVIKVANPVWHINRQSPQVTATLVDKTLRKGQLLYVDENVLVLARQKSLNQWPAAENLHVLPRSSLYRVHVAVPRKLGLLRSYGTTLYNDSTAFSANITAPLKEVAALPSFIPPELTASITETLAQQPNTRFAGSESPTRIKRMWRHWDLTMTSRIRGASVTSAFKLFFDGQDSGRRDIFFASPSLQLDYYQSLTLRTDLIGRLHYRPRYPLQDTQRLDGLPGLFLSTNESDRSFFQVSGISFDVLWNINLMSPARQLQALQKPAFLDLTEMRIEIGPTFSYLHIDTRAARAELARFYTAYASQNQTIYASTFEVGGYFGAKLTRAINRWLAIGLDLRVVAFPSLEIDYRDSRNPLQDDRTFEFQPLVAKSDFFYDASLALRFRIHL